MGTPMHETKGFRLLVMDVDGTLTDGKIYVGADGEQFKAFHIKDGYGIKNILPGLGIRAAILTGRTSDIVKVRAKELDISLVIQGAQDKLTALRSLVAQLSLCFSQVIYMGDDLNDFAAMQACGLKACPADAAPEILAIANFVSTRNGGEGAVRELIDWIRG